VKMSPGNLLEIIPADLLDTLNVTSCAYCAIVFCSKELIIGLVSAVDSTQRRAVLDGFW